MEYIGIIFIKIGKKNNEGKTQFMIYSSEFIHLHKALFIFSVEDTWGLSKLAAVTHGTRYIHPLMILKP